MDTMEKDPVTQDIDIIDGEHPSGLEHLNIDSDGHNMLGFLLRAQGPGPHPTAVILHGFPGHEGHSDLAHVLHRAGWNSVLFHYRGAWGSEGEFSFSNMIDDVHACLFHLRGPEWAETVQAERIVLIGHSMGGWAALMAAIDDAEVQETVFIAGFNLGSMAPFITESGFNRKLVEASFGPLVRPLGGADPSRLIDEIVLNGEGWDLIGNAKRMINLRVLMIGAARDNTAIPELHHIPLSKGLKDIGMRSLTDVILDSDHNFSDRRIELCRTVLDWLRSGM
jgi:pimeloyl-ACP methyl ester carboxylesterase